jgi:hypothetical protein
LHAYQHRLIILLSNFKVISHFSPPGTAAARQMHYATYAMLGHTSDQLSMMRFPGSMELEAANQEPAYIGETDGRIILQSLHVREVL